MLVDFNVRISHCFNNYEFLFLCHFPQELKMVFDEEDGGLRPAPEDESHFGVLSEPLVVLHALNISE